jgi:hypothetical protein
MAKQTGPARSASPRRGHPHWPTLEELLTALRIKCGSALEIAGQLADEFPDGVADEQLWQVPSSRVVGSFATEYSASSRSVPRMAEGIVHRALPRLRKSWEGWP